MEADFRELRQSEVRRIPLLGTWVNKGKKFQSISYRQQLCPLGKEDVPTMEGSLQMVAVERISDITSMTPHTPAGKERKAK